MDNIYLFFVVALFILAISDLVVGVGNDAVNFLNSAVGAKVAPFKVILAIAGAGVLVGATFSSGMMEIARSGVFHPGQFYFNEIMIIFLAVMITDVILLDMFNTYGLPTSTTVSIVFELLGAAVAVALYKIYLSPETLQDLGIYINSARALAIISGILLSVVIAFTVGSMVQFFSRWLFTFSYEKKIPYFGALWGSIAVTSIVYFILVKGASGASFMTTDAVAWIRGNTLLILGSCFISFAVILQILIMVFKVNVFRIIVLIGTFSIAMAFAGNDLVNFIGVPLAGYESYKLFLSDPSINPETYTMESLLLPVQTPTYFLLAAGVIMILALFFSKKARSVTKTEVDLARQGDGYERFSSSIFAQTIVRRAIDIGNVASKVIPGPIMRSIEKRFDQSMVKRKKKMRKDNSHFDMLRASVNMFIAAILIALATSMKLPLSTTYVTFMVAMGTSLSDRAWGRESAVYRVTGVLMVIGGWFFTAFTAFSVAFLIALAISWGGVVAAVIALLLAFTFVVRTNFIHKRRSEQEKKDELLSLKEWDEKGVIEECKNNIINTLTEVASLLNNITIGFIYEDRKKVKKARKKVKALNDYTKELKKNLFITLRKLEKGSIETGHHYVQVLDYLREISHCLNFIVDPIHEHLENNHPTVIAEQESLLCDINSKNALIFKDILEVLNTEDYARCEQITQSLSLVLNDLENFKKVQLELIKAEKVSTRNSLVIFNLVTETKNVLMHSINVLKSHRDFLSKNEQRLIS
jgi:phosphate/sulfate permease